MSIRLPIATSIMLLAASVQAHAQPAVSGMPAGSGFHSDPGHCHVEPRFHINAYGFHRHDETSCKSVQMRPQYGAPSPDANCVIVGVVRFCDQ